MLAEKPFGSACGCEGRLSQMAVTQKHRQTVMRAGAPHSMWGQPA